MIELYNGDCLEVMKELEDKSIDLVLTDPPYGTTECSWDTVIDLEKMWKDGGIERIIKPDRAIVLFSSQPFTSNLIMSNVDLFKYSLVWKKSKVQHFAQAPYRFLTIHEDICVFSFAGTAKNAKNRMVFNPQGTKEYNKIHKGKSGWSHHRANRSKQKDYKQTKTNYPKSILEFSSVSKTLHPTQKPEELMEYLIKTYSNEGDTVLDFTMGSGTTGVACKRLNRNFIGVELDKDYYEIAKKRIDETEVKQEKSTSKDNKLNLVEF